jgi:predicted transcriptional regulator
MKNKITLQVLFLILFFLVLTAFPIKSQSFKMDVKFKAHPKRTLEITGSFTGSGLVPKGHRNVNNTVNISLEMLQPNGKYRILPEYIVVYQGNGKDGRILTGDEEHGINSSTIRLHSQRLDNIKDEGKSFSFSTKVELPIHAEKFRFIGTLSHGFSGTWEAMTFYNDIGNSYNIKDIKFPPEIPCKDKKLNEDSDGDGIENWQDACPNTKGKLGSYGCVNQAALEKVLLDFAEKHYREEIRDVLKCSGIDNPNYHAVKLNFEYTGTVKYDKNVIYLPDPKRWIAYWLAKKEEECTGKIKSLPKDDRQIFTSIFHEVGHYIAELIGMEDVSGAGSQHNTWIKSNPGVAFDEGRADLIMLLFAKKKNMLTLKTKSGLSIGGDYGKEVAKVKLSRDPGAAMSTEGAVTSVMYDSLPLNPCEALKELIQGHKEYKKYTGESPQNLRDWIIGYNLYKKRISRTLEEMVEFDKKIIKILRDYQITPEGFGFIQDIRNGNSINVYEIRQPDFEKQDEFIKFIGLKNMPNFLHVGKVDVQIEVNPKAFLKINAKSEYTIDIQENGLITIKVIKGSLEITPPNGKPEEILTNKIYTWKPEPITRESLQKFICDPCIEDDLLFIKNVHKAIFEEETGADWYIKIKHREEKLNREQLIMNYFNSAAYKELNKDNTSFIIDLYQAILGKNPTPLEIHHWVDSLNTGRERTDIIIEFLQSTLYRKVKLSCK